MPRLTEIARWFLGVLWFVSWLFLYLEIFRYHHVTWALLLDPAAWFQQPDRHSQPGRFLNAVLVSSVVAPSLFAVPSVWRRWRGSDASNGAAESTRFRFPLACVALTLGLAMAIFGAVNQAIRRPPVSVDLTLQTGNGGFVVLGVGVATLGVLGNRRSRRLRGA